MKLIKKSITEKDGSGTVKLRCEDAEDMWHAYNLVSAGDRVRAPTFRKVVKSSSTGSVTSNKVRLNLVLSVIKTEFDSETCVMRVTGRNAEPNPHVRLGAHHTLDLEPNRDFSIEKGCWDQIALERIETACSPEKTAELAAVVMQPGLAHLCLIKGEMTILKAKVDISIPKKRAGASAHQKAVRRFYEAIYQAVLRHVDFSVVKVLLVASPGFSASDWLRHATSEAVRHEERAFLDHRSKVVLTRSSSGHKRALEEVLADPAVASRLADVGAAAEVRALGAVFEMLRADSSRAFYGYDHVTAANELQAVDKLLVTDSLFRASDPRERRKYVDLVESVRENAGRVYVFSSLHVSGEQLKQLTGVAALLRYPLPDLEDMQMAEETDSDSDAEPPSEAEEDDGAFAEEAKAAGF